MENIRVARKSELTYNCLETRVKLCQERWLILQCQDSFFNHCTFNIIILNHHIFFQYFDCIELLCPLPVGQHHLHKEKWQGENLPTCQGGKVTHMPNDLYRWQSSFSFYWYTLGQNSKNIIITHPLQRAYQSFQTKAVPSPSGSSRHIAKGLLKR